MRLQYLLAQIFCLVAVIWASPGVLASETTNQCSPLTLQNYHGYLDAETTHLIQDPFDRSCVILTYGTEADSALNAHYQSQDPAVVEAHQNFLKKDQTSVLMLTRPSDQARFTFFHFNRRPAIARYYSDPWNEQKVLSSFNDDFFFLHEVIHLDPEITRSKDIRLNQKEAISDIGAALMIVAKHQFSPQKSTQLMKDIYRVRSTHIKEFGDVIQRIDKDHFNKRALKTAVRFFEELEQDNRSLYVTSIAQARDLAKSIVIDEPDLQQSYASLLAE